MCVGSVTEEGSRRAGGPSSQAFLSCTSLFFGFIGAVCEPSRALEAISCRWPWFIDGTEIARGPDRSWGNHRASFLRCEVALLYSLCSGHKTCIILFFLSAARLLGCCLFLLQSGHPSRGVPWTASLCPDLSPQLPPLPAIAATKAAQRGQSRSSHSEPSPGYLSSQCVKMPVMRNQQ